MLLIILHYRIIYISKYKLLYDKWQIIFTIIFNYRIILHLQTQISFVFSDYSVKK